MARSSKAEARSRAHQALNRLDTLSPNDLRDAARQLGIRKSEDVVADIRRVVSVGTFATRLNRFAKFVENAPGNNEAPASDSSVILKQQFVYKSTLKNTYGLTPSLIDELGPPDKTVVNPRWANAPSASLYSVERVEEWIDGNIDRVEQARAIRAKRSAAQRAVHDKKRAGRWAEAEAWMNGVAIAVKRPLPVSLLADARKRFTILDDADLSQVKALHAHVRHHHTNYESLLYQLNQREFNSELYLLLRQRIDPLVAEAIQEWCDAEAEANAAMCIERAEQAVSMK